MSEPSNIKPLTFGMTTLIGYARVSTADQNMAMQIEALENAGCRRVFSDVASGAKSNRPGLEQALAFLRPGDTLLVWKIDRLGRSTSHLVQIIDNLRERGIAFRSLNDPGMDTSTNTGKLMFSFFAILADFERELIRERTKAGLASAKARGRSSGRRPVITPIKLQRAQKLMEKGATVREAAAAIKVGKTALYEALRVSGSADAETGD